MEHYKQIFEIQTVTFVKRMNFMRRFSIKLNNLSENISYFDPDKIVRNDTYDDFLVDFLSSLEPTYFIEGETIIRPHQVVNSAYFFHGTEVEIGYNLQRFL